MYLLKTSKQRIQESTNLCFLPNQRKTGIHKLKYFHSILFAFSGFRASSGPYKKNSITVKLEKGDLGVQKVSLQLHMTL